MMVTAEATKAAARTRTRVTARARTTTAKVMAAAKVMATAMTRPGTTMKTNNNSDFIGNAIRFDSFRLIFDGVMVHASYF